MNSCILCLELSDKLVELSHCGIYYIHSSCHKKWLSKNNTCIICRQIVMPPITINLSMYYFIVFKVYYILTIFGCFGCFGMTIYIFVTCDVKSPYCKLF